MKRVKVSACTIERMMKQGFVSEKFKVENGLEDDDYLHEITYNDINKQASFWFSKETNIVDVEIECKTLVGEDDGKE